MTENVDGINNTDGGVPNYIALPTGGKCHQIYRRNPLLDNGMNLGYVNHTPHIIYKSREACQRAIEALNG